MSRGPEGLKNSAEGHPANKKLKELAEQVEQIEESLFQLHKLRQEQTQTDNGNDFDREKRLIILAVVKLIFSLCNKIFDMKNQIAYDTKVTYSYLLASYDRISTYDLERFLTFVSDPKKARLTALKTGDSKVAKKILIKADSIFVAEK